MRNLLVIVLFSHVLLCQGQKVEFQTDRTDVVRIRSGHIFESQKEPGRSQVFEFKFKSEFSTIPQVAFGPVYIDWEDGLPNGVRAQIEEVTKASFKLKLYALSKNRLNTYAIQWYAFVDPNIRVHHSIINELGSLAAADNDDLREIQRTVTFEALPGASKAIAFLTTVGHISGIPNVQILVKSVSEKTVDVVLRAYSKSVLDQLGWCLVIGKEDNLWAQQERVTRREQADVGRKDGDAELYQRFTPPIRFQGKNVLIGIGGYEINPNDNLRLEIKTSYNKEEIKLTVATWADTDLWGAYNVFAAYVQDPQPLQPVPQPIQPVVGPQVEYQTNRLDIIRYNKGHLFEDSKEPFRSQVFEIKFNQDFQVVPQVAYTLVYIDWEKGSPQGLKTEIVEVSKSGFKLKLQALNDKQLSTLQIEWHAFVDPNIRVCHDNSVELGSLTISDQDVRSIEKTCSFYQLQGASRAIPFLTTAWHRQGLLIEILIKSVTDSNAVVTIKSSGKNFVNQVGWCVIIGKEHNLWVAPQLRFNRKETEEGKKMYDRGPGDAEIVLKLTPPAEFRFKNLISGISGHELNPVDTMRLEIEPIENKKEIKLAVRTWSNTDVWASYNHIAAYIKPKPIPIQPAVGKRADQTGKTEVIRAATGQLFEKSVAPPVRTKVFDIKFNSDFEVLPQVGYSVIYLDQENGYSNGFVSEIVEVTKQGFKLRLSTLDAVHFYAFYIQWYAFVDSEIRVCHELTRDIGELDDVSDKPRSLDLSCSYYALPGASKALPFLTSVEHTYLWNIDIAVKSVTDKETIVTFKVLAGSRVALLGLCLIIGREDNLWVAPQLRFDKRETDQNKNFYERGTGEVTLIQKATPPAKFVEKDVLYGMAGYDVSPKENLRLTISNTYNKEEIRLQVLTWWNSITYGSYNYVGVYLKDRPESEVKSEVKPEVKSEVKPEETKRQSQVEECAEIFEECDYKGKSLKICDKVNDFAQEGWNKPVKSVKVVPGKALLLHDKENQQGKTVKFTTNQQCLDGITFSMIQLMQPPLLRHQ